jgi:CheY-like chemotaxis protein
MLGHRHRILIVEDDQTLREALEIILRMEGYGVASADQGQHALDRLREGLQPCVILLDLAMPVKDGWQFRSEQVQDPNLARIPVIVCSATEASQARVQALGVEHLLRKPIGLDELMDVVSQYCQREQRAPALR